MRARPPQRKLPYNQSYLRPNMPFFFGGEAPLRAARAASSAAIISAAMAALVCGPVSTG